MEIHNQMGTSFLEIADKDASEYEFWNHGFPFEREEILKLLIKTLFLSSNSSSHQISHFAYKFLLKFYSILKDIFNFALVYFKL